MINHISLSEYPLPPRKVNHNAVEIGPIIPGSRQCRGLGISLWQGPAPSLSAPVAPLSQHTRGGSERGMSQTSMVHDKLTRRLGRSRDREGFGSWVQLV